MSLSKHLPMGYIFVQSGRLCISIEVGGTTFWRAPKVLEACRRRNVGRKPELFTREADNYSYGMTCYEVLIGKVPFEDHPLRDQHGVLMDLVIDQHLRPKVPDYVEDWAWKLLHGVGNELLKKGHLLRG